MTERTMDIENSSIFNVQWNGPEGVRTPDLMTASHARSQLRHRPVEQQSIVAERVKGGQCVRGVVEWRDVAWAGPVSERQRFPVVVCRRRVHAVFADAGCGAGSAAARGPATGGHH